MVNLSYIYLKAQNKIQKRQKFRKRLVWSYTWFRLGACPGVKSMKYPSVKFDWNPSWNRIWHGGILLYPPVNLSETVDIEKACFKIHDPCKCGYRAHRATKLNYLASVNAMLMADSAVLKCILVARLMKRWKGYSVKLVLSKWSY